MINKLTYSGMRTELLKEILNNFEFAKDLVIKEVNPPIELLEFLQERINLIKEVLNERK